MKDYNALYQEALADKYQFWDRVARETLTWFKPWHTITRGDFTGGRIEWFSGAELNASYNCLDRHLAPRGDKIALIAEGNEPGAVRQFTYRQLYEAVCQFANLLKRQGFKKGDRLAIYMPMIAEAVIAMLACARLGMIHSVVFGGFSAESLRARIIDAHCTGVITVNSAYRGKSPLQYRENVAEAVAGLAFVKSVMIFEHGAVLLNPADLEINATTRMAQEQNFCECEILQSEDPLFILYTSGSTGKPKGVLHTLGGYLTYSAFTHKLVFDLQEEDIYFCTADVGWITGHSYGVYGPLANGATTVIFEGIPTYPTPERYWQMVDQHKISIFYTAPTAIRALMQQGDTFLQSSSRDSLRLLGSVGEPLNPEAWEWYARVVGQDRCPIMDTWWQTETGGILMAPLVAKAQQKPGATMRPLPGIKPEILAEQDFISHDNETEGALLIREPWPGLMHTVYGDHQRFLDAYLKPNPGFYTTGDGAKKDKDNDYWILGRMDDVLNVAGHRIGTAEVESALVLHKSVAEAAVVGMPHPIKGQGIFAFVALMQGVRGSDTLKAELIAQVRHEIGPIATPDQIQFVAELPKTRSGKIMRRILRKIVEHDDESIGDVSTLANPDSVEVILNAFLQSEQ